VVIKLFATLRLPGIGPRVSVTVGENATVRDALEALFAAVPDLREPIWNDGTGALQPHVNILLRGRLVRDLQGLDTPVRNGDELAVFPPVAGG